MKDRVREALFNLIGLQVKGSHVVDLFAGTGALAIEALSRGAVRATLIERHFPTASQMKVALERLGLAAVSQVLPGDAFYWGKRLVEANAASEGLPDGTIPWLVFCCPPYQLYLDRREDLKSMIASIVDHAPPGSQVVVEFDERFDAAELCRADQWQTRTYLPATIAILRIGPL
jgi:16S rRNA (guanine966-N2)-methyltransferase